MVLLSRGRESAVEEVPEMVAISGEPLGWAISGELEQGQPG